MTDDAPHFVPDDAAWSTEHKAIVRIMAVERGPGGPVPARYTVMLHGGATITNFPGYSLREPTESELEALFGEAQHDR